MQNIYALLSSSLAQAEFRVANGTKSWHVRLSSVAIFCKVYNIFKGFLPF